MKKSKRLIDYYSNLWKLPNLKILYIYLIILFALIFVIINFKQSSYFFSFFYLILLLILFFNLIIFKKIDKFTSLKRIIGVTVFNGTGVLFSYIFYFLIPFYNQIISLSIIILFLSLATITLLYITTLNKILIFIMANSLSILFLLIHQLIYVNYLQEITYLIIKNYLIYLISILLILIYLNYIKRKGLKLTKIDPLKSFKGFLLSWLNKENQYFEKILNENSNEKISFEIPTIILKNKNKKKKISLISLPIHPGPFLNIGSSDLPSKLLNFNKEKILPFHGFTTHEMDLITSKEKNMIINHIVNKIEKENPNFDVFCTKMLSIKSDSFLLKGFLVNNVPIITVSSIKGDVDDLPYYIYNIAKKISKKIGYKDIFIIDAHNSYNENILDTIYFDNIKSFKEEILNNIKEILRKLKKEKLYKSKIGISNINFNKVDEKEMGKGKGKIITFVSKNFCNALILIDSNNINKELREKVIKKIEKLNINGEICSTDTHILTGKFTGRKGYYPLGENKETHESIVTSIIKALKKSIKSASYSKFKLIYIKTPQVKIFGNLYIKYEKLVQQLISYGKIFPYISYIIILIVSLIFYPLL